jgi:hypothetical protein
MARFLVIRDTYISHAGKVAKAGEEVEFDIPSLNGKPMVIGDNLDRLDKPAKVKKTEGDSDKGKGEDLA